MLYPQRLSMPTEDYFNGYVPFTLMRRKVRSINLLSGEGVEHAPVIHTNIDNGLVQFDRLLNNSTTVESNVKVIDHCPPRRRVYRRVNIRGSRAKLKTTCSINKYILRRNYVALTAIDPLGARMLSILSTRPLV